MFLYSLAALSIFPEKIIKNEKVKTVSCSCRLHRQCQELNTCITVERNTYPATAQGNTRGVLA